MEDVKKEDILDLCSGMVGSDGFDVHSFNDKLAEIIDWSPVRSKGVLRTKRRIRKTGFNKFRYTVAIRDKILLISFIALGTLSMIWGTFNFLLSTNSFQALYIWSAVIGVIMLACSVIVMILKSNQFIFDKNKKILKNKQDKIELEKIHALQLLKKQFTIKKIVHTCYELNLILEDASRIHLVDYDKSEHINKDAKTISDFLKVKVWKKTI